MHFPERRPDQSDQHMLPLINVIFLLLIFFMLVSSLTVSDIYRIQPPQSASQQSPDNSELTLLLNADGQLALNNQPIEQPALLDLLEQQLQQAPNTRIALKADGQLPATQLVALTDALYRIGVTRLTLVTEPAMQ